MPLDPILILLVALVMGAAALIQTTVGFASALFAVPALVWLGLSLPQAVSLQLACVLLQGSWATWHLRHDVPWRPALWSALVRMLVMPVGLLALTYVHELEASRVKQIVGGIVLLTVIVMVAARVKPRSQVHPSWAALAFPASRFMAGLCGMGGPPIVLWAMAHDWPNRRYRAFLNCTFTLLAPCQAVLLYLAFGKGIFMPIVVGFVVSPAVVLGAHLGLSLGHRLSSMHLRLAAYVILLGLGVSSVVAPLLDQSPDAAQTPAPRQPVP